MGRYSNFRRRKVFTTSFEEELLEEFTKQCLKERKDRNEVLTQLIEGYLRKNVEAMEQKLSLYVKQELTVIPDIHAPKEEWREYWTSITDLKEITRLEGLFHMRYNEVKEKYYQLKNNNRGIEVNRYIPK